MKRLVFFFALLMSSLQAKYEAIEFHLKNGLKIVCIEKKSTPIVSFSIWYRCGSKCDAVSKSGVAHYLEHMAFVSNKGKFRDFLEEIGADKNASTSINNVCFYEIVPSNHIETVFKHEAKRMQSFDIDDKIFLAEKGAILEERSTNVDNYPNGARRESMLANVFGRKIGGIEIIGWKHEIESIEKQDLYDFHDKWFAPNNATIVIAGDFDLKEVKTFAEKYFGKIKTKELPKETENSEIPSFLKEIKYSSPKNGSLSSVEYIYYVPFLSKKDFRKSIVLDVAVTALNKPDFFAKKILKHVSNKATGVSFYYADRIFQFDILCVNITCSSLNDLYDAEKIWKYLPQKIVGTGITKSELDSVKKSFLISMAYKKDDIGEISSHFGWLLSCGYSVNEIQSMDDIIQSVTVKECNDALREVFSFEPIAISRTIPKGYDRV